MEEENLTGEKKFQVKTIISSIIILIVVVLLALVITAYFVKPGSDSFWGRIFSRISYPAAIVDNTNVIYVSTVRENLVALRTFYESQNFSKVGMRVDFSTEDGVRRLKIKEKEILNKAIEDKIIEILSKQRGIVVTKKDATSVVAAKLEEFNNKDQTNDNLKQMYGWNLDQFKTNIVIPELYSEKLKAAVAQEIGIDKQALELINKAQKELAGGKDFAEIARSYSQGASASEGGEIGWITKKQLLPEVAAKIFIANSSSATVANEVIESSLGYHIVQVEENKKENGVDMVRIRQIFAAKKTFGEWLEEQMKTMNIKVILRDYEWDEQKAVVIFKDEQMKIFEKQAYENSDGDASMIF